MTSIANDPAAANVSQRRLTGAHGEPLSTISRRSAELYDRAVELFAGLRMDPFEALDAAFAEEPGFVSGRLVQAGLCLGAFDPNHLAPAREAIAAARAGAATANPRERSLLAALDAWATHGLASGLARFDRHNVDFPRDLFALQLAHQSDLVAGRSTSLRDRIGRARMAWSAADAGFGYVLGMHAFGFEECHEFAAAEALGREAVALQPGDTWAVHAVAHVCEMQGRADDGLAFLAQTESHWHGGMLGVHNHWHSALMHMRRGDFAAALSVYDRMVYPAASDIVLDLVDAAALLWRLELAGVDVAGRWAPLAAVWRAKGHWGYSIFNDLHALLAFSRADADAAIGLREAAVAAACNPGDGSLWRDLALPAFDAVRVLAVEPARTTELLLPMLARTLPIGGSNAQRDLLHLTALGAAQRAGDIALVHALGAERAARLPVGHALPARRPVRASRSVAAAEPVAA